MTTISPTSIPEADRIVKVYGGVEGTEIHLTVSGSIMEWDEEDHPDDWREGPGEYRIEVAFIPAGLVVSIFVNAESRAEAIAKAVHMVKVEAY